MTDYKDVYADTWAKAVKNVKYVSQLVFQSLKPPLKVKLGFAAVSDQLDNSKHNKSEPDILISDNGQVVAGIEVTGSDRVNFPCIVWVASHKLQFMLEAPYPIAYVLFYRNNKTRFLGSEVLQGHARPYDVIISSNLEKYHWIDPKYTEDFSALKAWLLKIQTDYFARKTWAKAKISEGGVSH